MTSTAPRRRASTLKAPQAEVTELRLQLGILGQAFLADGDTYENELDEKIRAGQRIRQSLQEDTAHRHTRDAFRHANGFQTILSVLKNLEDLLHSRSKTSLPNTTIYDLLQTVILALSAALLDHRGNDRFFRYRIEGGGWKALEEAMKGILSTEGRDGEIGLFDLFDRISGCLLSCALEDDSVLNLPSSFRRRFAQNLSALSPQDSSPPPVQNVDMLPLPEAEKKSAWLDFLQKNVDPLVVLCRSEPISVILGLWEFLKRRYSDYTEGFKSITWSLLEIISHISQTSMHNLNSLHEAGALGRILPSLVDLHPPYPPPEQQLLVLAKSLLRIGVASLDEAHFMYKHARSSPVMAELVLYALRVSRVPSFVYFDLSIHGYASVELPGIGCVFPPQGSSAGYSLSMWVEVLRFDPNSHTTLFGAFDASQTCFVLVYIEKDTRNLILQTSVTSSRPSVRFKSTSFKENRWYHIIITHQRAKTTSSARASLFINGEFVEQVKSQYPASVTSPGKKPGMDTSGSTKKHEHAIQAFLGTPQDLATRLGRGLVLTQWRLASSHLFSDVLNDDLIAVYYQLGPRYVGNFQDCLGSFQTYEASAALNLRNESLHPGKEDRSDIITAIRSKAGYLLPESLVMLNIAASVVLDDNDTNNINETHLIRSLSKVSSKNLWGVTRGGRNALAINGAVPSINDALLNPSGFAVLTGDPCTVVPGSLDDAAWRVAGCAPVGLAILETAETSSDILRSVQIIFESIRHSWRNSEAMERDNGFGALANLLTSKLELRTRDQTATPSPVPTSVNAQSLNDSDLDLQVLSIVLEFVGYRQDRPEESVINNPLAYRILIVDLEIWRTRTSTVQTLYYEQFITFASRSKFKQFNLKRLLRMRVLKKWLESLKGSTFNEETFDYFLAAFKVIFERGINAESMRSLSLYITYAIHTSSHKETQLSRAKSLKVKAISPLPKKANADNADTSSNSMGDVKEERLKELSQRQIALRLIEMYAEMLCSGRDIANLNKFARTVTNKWLLHLLADDEAAIVVAALRILARLLVVSGPAYVNKFTEKTGGIAVLQHRLKSWWHVPEIWYFCFAILFGIDVARIAFPKSFNLFNLIEAFGISEKTSVVYPQVLPVLTNMLQCGLATVNRAEPNQFSSSAPKEQMVDRDSSRFTLPQRPSANVHDESEVETQTLQTGHHQPLIVLNTVLRFLTDVHARSQVFRDFAASSSYIQELLSVLFFLVSAAEPIAASTELQSRESNSNDLGKVLTSKTLSATSLKTVATSQSINVSKLKRPKPSEERMPRRMSSYVMVNSKSIYEPLSSSDTADSGLNEKTHFLRMSKSQTVQELLELTIAIFIDQIFIRKDFPGLGLFMRVPPALQEHQVHFETYLLRNVISHIKNHIKLNQRTLWEPKVLTNLARFATHIGEAIYEGWFNDGAEVVVELLAEILEYLQLPEVSTMKSIRLCTQIILSIKTVLLRVVLLRLSELGGQSPSGATVAFLEKLAYWQVVLQPVEDAQIEYFRLLCYLLYGKLISSDDQVNVAAVNLWRMLIVQRPNEISEMLQNRSAESGPLINGFEKIIELDNEVFLRWVKDNQELLEESLFSRLGNMWADFVSAENQKTQDTARARISRRKDRLRQWDVEKSTYDEAIHRHEISTEHWRSNIFAAEDLKRQRTIQDQLDNHVFNSSTWTKMKARLQGPCGLFDSKRCQKWQLDLTEGRDRMRLRLIPDLKSHGREYQPKRQRSQGQSRSRRSIGIRDKITSKEFPIQSAPGKKDSSTATTSTNNHQEGLEAVDAADGDDSDENIKDNDFEIVDGPQEDLNHDDKNRKVMRSLQRGDQVEHVHNVARILGLEAIEGLLILGKSHLYLLDTLFQRSDGEVVNSWQAPPEERDPYLQMISGRQTDTRSVSSTRADFETRHWRWGDVLSISKRRFLFRDVAIELFFIDGRSYLLTASKPLFRDELFQKLVSMTPGNADRASGPNEDSWRMELLRNPADEAQNLGSKFTNVFSSASVNPATRRWIRGEMSNFQYLMLVNTMAGRTFNDLTQYPVFPWVIADYTSEELDLKDPRSFRDLSKPMGCQTAERRAEFRDRYQSLTEMGDHTAQPFHYGTHYSSAMIVTSYLIRIQPFVQSYLLLQGGSFDHADRMFYSIEKAWASASKDNMTDVRELIPEFFYLPDFLSNLNGYDFGLRQGTGGRIDHVALPPWAKGDPKIFVAKNREALESNYVSQNLHLWIDLIFGHKQRGETAVEATNVFHYLSYHGAKDLDNIEDPVERLATIGIIHNFGQTPHQIFQKAHAARDDPKNKTKRLDSAAENLTRLPFHLFENGERIVSLQYSQKLDRVVPTGSFRIDIGPSFDKYMVWGFVDHGVRFFSSDSNKLLGLFEHVHQNQLSCAIFADSKTLVTAGTDCTISVWTVISNSKTVDLQPRTTLFGHRQTPNVLAVSRSFSALLSASFDGCVNLWDLNRLDLVRVLTTGRTVECARINDMNGTILLCRGPEVSIWTLNGDLILQQDIFIEGEDQIFSCAFYEGSGGEYLERNLIFTGQRRGVVNVWSIAIRRGTFALEHVKAMHHLDQAGFNIGAPVTAVLPLARAVYTGDEDGRVFEWDCIQRQ